MKLGSHQSYGPLELADLSVSTNLPVGMQVLHEGLADTKYACPLLVKYVECRMART